ncbi:MAG: LysR family transcriptional regulator [Ruminococcaceae bacterium]|nr:LysR family transcriptional regulator [Oscillospiraceae bacterium]
MFSPRLETLLMVAEKQNFTQAAQALSLTQPAVSHHIASLEEELGAKLFQRGKNRLLVTPEGEIVLKYARRVRALYEKMHIELSDAAKDMTRVRIGITHTSESNIITEVLGKYASEEGHRRSITILTDTINNLYDMLSDYRIDLAIVEGRPRDPGISALLLDTDYLVCVVSNNHPLSKKSMVTLSDIRRENLILRLPNSGTRNLFVSHIEQMNMTLEDFQVILEVDNIATIKDLVRKDMGISILAKSACIDELKKGKITVLPIENLSMIREINILYHNDFSHREMLEELMQLYRATARLYV